MARIREQSINLFHILRDYGTLGTLFLLIIIFGILKPNEFLSIKNTLNIIHQVAPLGIVSIGLTFLIIMKNYDLSIGYLASLSGVVVTTLFAKGFPEMAGILLTLLLCGVLVGLLNGCIVTFLGVPSLVVTIGTGFLLFGVTWIICGGKAVFYGIPKHFAVWGQGMVGIVPVSVIILAVIFIVSYIIIEKTSFGRYAYAIGNNETASNLSGVNVRFVKLISFILCSVFSSMAGILLASEVMCGHTTGGDRYLLSGLTAVFLGTSIFRKGEGNIWGTLVGVFILGIAYNGMTMLGTPYAMREVITGVILIVALAISRTQLRLN